MSLTKNASSSLNKSLSISNSILSALSTIDIKPKYYITVHDTGDADPTHTAKFWSNTVRDEYWEQGKYACSYQYVVGNDGTYHNIPDEEVAYHAGDGTKFDYRDIAIIKCFNGLIYKF